MPVSSVTAKVINASMTDVAFLYLLTITPYGGEPIYLVNNLEEVNSRGKKYLPYPFSMQLPADDTTRIPSVTLTIDNVDRLLVQSIRAQLQPPSIKVELITTLDPDNPEKVLDFLELRDVSYDASTIQGTLVVSNIMSQRFPKESYDPVSFPDLFY